MAYKKHTWKKGEKITSELLNNLESGVDESLKDIEILYSKFEDVETLVGLEGEAPEIKPLKKEAELPEIVAKINELINGLQARGVSK